MSAAEELKEQIERAEAPFDKKVAASMAILAAVLAVVSVLGHISTTEELLVQQKASDQWSYYQAKSIRRYESEFASDLFASMKNDAMSKQYSQNAAKYQSDDDEIQKQAQDLEKESGIRGRQALRFHLGEVFLEIAIVFASLAILTKRAFIWYAGIAGGVVGAVIALTALQIA